MVKTTKKTQRVVQTKAKQHTIVAEPEVIEKIVIEPVVIEEPKCNCVDYDGQDFFCKIHTVVNECPRCHCVKAERLILGALPPITQYSCTICGIFYIRNNLTGEYTHYK